MSDVSAAEIIHRPLLLHLNRRVRANAEHTAVRIYEQNLFN